MIFKFNPLFNPLQTINQMTVKTIERAKSIVRLCRAIAGQAAAAGDTSEINMEKTPMDVPSHQKVKSWL